MKKITESELKNKVLGLKEKMAELENRQLSEVNWGAIGTGAMNAVKGAGTAIGNALSTTGGKIAGGAALGAGALAAGQQLTKPTGATTGAKSDPAILKQQQDLIAKGAKIKADGIMGPATQAAMKQFGGQAAAPAAAPTGTTAPAAPAGDAAKNPVGTTNASTAIPTGGLENPANQAKPAATPAATPAAAPAGMQAVGDDDGNTTITRPDGSTMVVGADGKQIMPGSNPNLPQNKGVLNTIKNAATGKGDFQKPTGFIPATPTPSAAPAQAVPGVKAGGEVVDTRGGLQGQDEMEESVTFQNDELSRILTLIHHR